MTNGRPSAGKTRASVSPTVCWSTAHRSEYRADPRGRAHHESAAGGCSDIALRTLASPLANGRVLDCSIVAPGAGELIGLWCLAIAHGLEAERHRLACSALSDAVGNLQAGGGRMVLADAFSGRTPSLVTFLRKLPNE